jgi:hypothetical protein
MSIYDSSIYAQPDEQQLFEQNPDLISKMVALQSVDPQQELLKEQSARADALRQNSKNPGGQMVGRRFIPPSPLQGLSGMLNQWTGQANQNKADKQRQALNNQTSNTLNDYLQAKLNVLRNGVQPRTNPDLLDAFARAQRAPNPDEDPGYGEVGDFSMLNSDLAYG